MDKKKYIALNLPASMIQELKDWKDAYSRSMGKTVTYEKMLEDMIACSRKFKWWRNNGRDIVTEYKAGKLAKAKNISLSKAKEKIIKYDNDHSTSSRGQNSIFSTVYEMDSEYVWDKDWKELI